MVALSSMGELLIPESTGSLRTLIPFIVWGDGVLEIKNLFQGKIGSQCMEKYYLPNFAVCCH
jgi:hypothetical protein